MADFVVCIKDINWYCGRRVHPNPPKKGRVYTVLANKSRKGGGTYIQLAEYPAKQWFVDRPFRPLSPSRLDIFRQVNVPITEKTDG